VGSLLGRCLGHTNRCRERIWLCRAGDAELPWQGAARLVAGQGKPLQVPSEHFVAQPPMFMGGKEMYGSAVS